MWEQVAGSKPHWEMLRALKPCVRAVRGLGPQNGQRGLHGGDPGAGAPCSHHPSSPGSWDGGEIVWNCPTGRHCPPVPGRQGTSDAHDFQGDGKTW